MASPSPNTDAASPRLASQSQTPDTPISSAASSQAVTQPSSWSPPVSSTDSSRPSARRGKITQIACVACRQRKSKCDGARPVCLACQSRPNTQCVYDVTLDQRKPSSLRQRVGELEQEVLNFKDILELLAAALPEKLRARFHDLAQQVDDGGMSDDLVEQLKQRLSGPQTPGDNTHLKELVQQMEHTDAKFNLGGGGSQVQMNPDQNPYFFDYSDMGNQDSPDTTMLGNPADLGLAIPMPVDNAGVGTSYWRLQSMQAPPWSASSGEPSEGGRAVTQPHNPTRPQDYRWLMSTGNPLRTLHLYGKVDGSSNNGAVDFDTNVPVHLVQPINGSDAKPLSSMYSGVYTGYRDSKRQALRGGANEVDILGYGGVDYGPAINPTNFHNDLSLTTWAAELFGAHRNLRASDRVASAWMVSALMRINPTRQNYEQMPAWLRPTPKQCFVPHAANLDYLPWPQVRDSLMDMATEQLEITVNSLSVNWPNSDGDIVYLDHASSKFVISPAFHTHISSLENWTLPGSILRSMPGLDGLARFDHDR